MPTLQNRIGIVQEIITNGVVDHVLGLRLSKKWPNSSPRACALGCAISRFQRFGHLTRLM